jgi:hypothetical protein
MSGVLYFLVKEIFNRANSENRTHNPFSYLYKEMQGCGILNTH